MLLKGLFTETVSSSDIGKKFFLSIPVAGTALLVVLWQNGEKGLKNASFCGINFKNFLSSHRKLICWGKKYIS